MLVAGSPQHFWRNYGMKPWKWPSTRLGAQP